MCGGYMMMEVYTISASHVSYCICKVWQFCYHTCWHNIVSGKTVSLECSLLQQHQEMLQLIQPGLGEQY